MSDSLSRLCLVEDDRGIRELLTRRLQREGYQVDGFASAEAVLKHGLNWDLFLLDVLLEGEQSGLDLCRQIRQQDPYTPVLFLSALSDPTDRVEALRLGADDYLGKPFEMEELLLRVGGMLRRRSWYEVLPEKGAIYRWDGREVDFAKLEARVLGKVFALSQKEAMLMKLLIEKEGQVVSRDEILDKVWGYDAYPSTRTVDNFLVRLRKYFEDDSSRPQYLQSVRGLGYRFLKSPKEGATL